MKFEEFEKNNQDKFIMQDVYAANRIRKTIEEMNLTDNEAGFELAKKYLIRNERSSKKSLSKFLLNALMSETTRGTDLLTINTNFKTGKYLIRID